MLKSHVNQIPTAARLRFPSASAADVNPMPLAAHLGLPLDQGPAGETKDVPSALWLPPASAAEAWASKRPASRRARACLNAKGTTRIMRLSAKETILVYGEMLLRFQWIVETARRRVSANMNVIRVSILILMQRETPVIRILVVMTELVICRPLVMKTAAARIVMGDVARVRVIKEAAGRDFAKHFK